MNTDHVWRYTLLGTVFTMMALAIVGQMLRIQLDSEQVAHFREQNTFYETEWRTVYPARGEIMDRLGNVLAGNTIVYQVGVELQNVENPHSIALTTNVVLGLDYNQVFKIASQDATEDHVFAVLVDFVTQDKIDALERFRTEIEETYARSRRKDKPSLAGLVYIPHLQRNYPEKSLASGVLGFVSREGEGYYGVESKFNEILAGEPQTVLVPRDPNLVKDMPDIPEGASLVLTLDRSIQAAMEEIIDDAVDANGADSGTIVVLQPDSGEILAMATTPRLDLNEYWRYSDIFRDDTPFNRAVSQMYEPGSIFKVLTMAAALDKGAVTPETSFLDTGVFEIGGTYIYNWNSGAWGPQDMLGCMQHSLNVCLAWVASQLGVKDFYAYMRAFGIGHLTGVDLGGENPGRLKTPGDQDWYDADLGTNAFGQGVAVTPLQMSIAAASLANDGKLMAPRIVRAIVKDGQQYDTHPRVVGIPITAKTAQTLTEMLARSLEEEASDALVEGYRMAGKTGTAEIPTPFGYSGTATNASFIGWGPVDDPQFLVFVWLEKPSTSPWGSIVAAPVFKDVVEKLVVLMDIPPDAIRQRLNSQ